MKLLFQETKKVRNQDLFIINENGEKIAFLLNSHGLKPDGWEIHIEYKNTIIDSYSETLYSAVYKVKNLLKKHFNIDAEVA